jgi:hypothetical protein
MNESSGWKAPLWGLGGLIIGMLIGSGVLLRPFVMVQRFAPGRGPMFGFGVPELIIVAVVGFWIVFWVLLIAALVRYLRGGRTGYRLADLPADFDDWHRRAHERMRETAAADDPGRRG